MAGYCQPDGELSVLVPPHSHYDNGVDILRVLK